MCSDYAHSILKNKDPAHDTIRNNMLDISTLFSWAEGRDYIEDNPFYRLKIPEGRKKSKCR